MQEARGKNNQSTAFSTKLNTKISFILRPGNSTEKKKIATTKNYLVINSIFGVFVKWDCILYS